MSDLEKKLKEYEDFELAFMVKYKLDSYSNSAANKVQEEVALRKLDLKIMEALIEEKQQVEIKEHDYKICPRCTSQKILTTKEEFYGNNKAFGLDSGKPLTYLEVKICAVCGWNFSVDESNYERRSRVRNTLISVTVTILFVLLLTYFFTMVDK